MTDENQDLHAGHSRIGRGAVRSRFFYAAAAVIMGAALHTSRNWGDWKAAFGLAVLWFALLFVYDRSRLGADWKAKQRAELEYMQAFGPAPYMFGFFALMLICALYDLALGNPWSSSGGTFLFALAGGFAGQAIAAWYQLKRSANAAALRTQSPVAET